MEPARKVLKGSEDSEKDVEVYAELSHVQQEALENIELIQSQIEELNERGADEILQIEVKYNEIREPYYVKRAKLIAQIPQFWLTVLLNHPTVGCLISTKDEDILSYLQSIDVKEYRDIKSGYKVIFNFSENPFFTNKIIEKDIMITYTDEGSTIRTKCSPIEWKEGEDITAAANLLSVGSKREHGANCKSIFSWFSDQDHIRDGDDIGDILKDDIFPNPLQYYVNPTETEIEDEEDDDDDDEEVVVEDNSEDVESQHSDDEEYEDIRHDEDQGEIEEYYEQESAKEERESADGSEEDLDAEDDFEDNGEYDDAVLDEEEGTKGKTESNM